MKFIRIGLLLAVTFLISACSQVEEFEHIEVFAIERLEENKEGLFEVIGYKKVNSITTIVEGKNQIKTDIQAIEDFYDIDGNYLKTEIIQSSFHKSNVTLAEDGENRKKELKKPITIFIPDENLEHFQLDNMTKEQKEEVKDHVLGFMDLL